MRDRCREAKIRCEMTRLANIIQFGCSEDRGLDVVRRGGERVVNWEDI